MVGPSTTCSDCHFLQTLLCTVFLHQVDVYYNRPIAADSYIGWSFSQSRGPISMNSTGSSPNGTQMIYVQDEFLKEGVIYNTSIYQTVEFSVQVTLSPSKYDGLLWNFCCKCIVSTNTTRRKYCSVSTTVWIKDEVWNKMERRNQKYWQRLNRWITVCCVFLFCIFISRKCRLISWIAGILTMIVVKYGRRRLL